MTRFRDQTSGVSTLIIKKISFAFNNQLSAIFYDRLLRGLCLCTCMASRPPEHLDCDRHIHVHCTYKIQNFAVTQQG